MDTLTSADLTRLWSQLDKITESLTKLSTEIGALKTDFSAFREASEARLARLEERSEESRVEGEHARDSRAKAFDKIDKISERVNELELAPARRALQKEEGDRKTIRTEVIRRLTALGVGIVLILVFLAGTGLVMKNYRPPSSPTAPLSTEGKR